MTPSSLAWLLTATLVAAPPAYKLDVASSQQVEAVLNYEVTAPNLKAVEWVSFAARLPELPGQVRVSSTLKPGGQNLVELSPLQRPILRSQVPADGPALETTLPLKVMYKAELRSRHLVELQPGTIAPLVPTLTALQRRAALGANKLLDHDDSDFRKWLERHQLRRRLDESDLDLARRVFLVIKKEFTYEYKPRMDRRASHICEAGASDCGGLSGVFVAALRANQVPARLLCGRWAKSSRPDDTLKGVPYYQLHVKAEFFAEGVGWVPADLSAAVEQKGGNPLAHFGHDRGDFLVFHVDALLEVDTVHFGKETINWLQTPRYWVTGGGKLDGTRIKQDWQVQSRRLDK